MSFWTVGPKDLSMTKITASIAAVALLGVGVAAQTKPTRPAARTAAPSPAPIASHEATLSPDEQNQVVSNVCSTCHDDEMKPGGLSLTSFDAATVKPETAELMIHKLRAGMMPPPSFVNDRPSNATLQAFAAGLENKVDSAAAQHPTPGRRMFQRLTRAEYEHAVKDLLDLDVDVNA